MMKCTNGSENSPAGRTGDSWDWIETRSRVRRREDNFFYKESNITATTKQMGKKEKKARK